MHLCIYFSPLFSPLHSFSNMSFSSRLLFSCFTLTWFVVSKVITGVCSFILFLIPLLCSFHLSSFYLSFPSFTLSWFKEDKVYLTSYLYYAFPSLLTISPPIYPIIRSFLFYLKVTALSYTKFHFFFTILILLTLLIPILPHSVTCSTPIIRIVLIITLITFSPQKSIHPFSLFLFF